MAASTQTIARKVATAFHDTISPALSPPEPTHEPDEVKFLEIVDAFHTGETLPALVPRTETAYETSVSLYIRLLTSVLSIWTSAPALRGVLGAEDRFDPAMLRFLYELFDIGLEYPFSNLLHRISRNVHSVISNPIPRFQVIFFKDLPNEIVHMITTFTDYGTLLALTQTSKAYRQIAVRRSYERSYFSLKYRNWVVHGPASCSEDALHLDALDAAENAVSEMVDTIHAFLNCQTAIEHVRFISIDYEWARLWPRFIRCDRALPRPTTSDVYVPMYRALVSLLFATRVKHVRFISVVLNQRLMDHLAVHSTLTAITFERYGGLFPLPHVLMPGVRRLTGVLFLGMLLDLEVTSHPNYWGLLAVCSSVRQVHAYGDRYAMTGFRLPIYPTAATSIMRIEYLHLQGCAGVLDNLILWLAAHPHCQGRPGALRRLKLHSIAPISHDDAFWLVSVLGAHHPSLRVLVLEGTLRVQPYLLSHIRDTLKMLESLTVISRSSSSQIRNRLCQWDHPCYEYAEAMRGFWTLLHLEVNMLWSPDSPSPRALDDLIAASARRCVYQDASTDRSDVACDGVRCYSAHPGETSREFFHDGYSIALPFLASLPCLEAFAIRDEENVYSCGVSQGDRICWIPAVEDERTGRHRALEQINPYRETTWDLGFF